MTRPEKGAPGPTAIGTRGQEKHQHDDSATAAPDRELMLSAALEYAKAGMAVFPVAGVRPDGTCRCGKADCNSIGKHPHSLAGLHGSKAATTDLEKISAWWRKDPFANIGILPAKCTPQMVVLDIDPRNGGDETLAELEKQHGPFSRLIECRSGGGGVHLWFKAPPNAQLPGKLGPGIDVLHNLYPVVPPSLHKSGNRYECADGRSLLDEFDREFMQTLPAWIAESRDSSTTGAAVDPPGEIDLQAREDAMRYPDTPANRARLLSALKSLDPDGSRDLYMTVLRGLHSTGWADWRELAQAWANGEMHGITCEKFDQRVFNRDVKGLGNDKAKSLITVASIFALAKAAGRVDEQREQQRKRAQAIGDGSADQLPLAPLMKLGEMLDEFVFISDGARVAHRSRPQTGLPLNEFKQRMRASQTQVGQKLMPTADLWMLCPQRITTHTLTFRPGHPEFTTDPEGNAALNLHQPRHRPESSASVDLFPDHVAYLVPDEGERERFLNWLAHIEQHPGVLPHTHYLMVAQQTGIGRNWLASLLARVWAGATRLGFDLMSAMTTGFNGALSRRLLVIVDELKAADTGYGAANHAEQLKAMLTTEHRGINPKYGRQHVEFNCARFLMFSQHFDALPLARTDRRVIVVSNPTERRSADYYARAYAMLDDQAFIDAVGNWLASRDIKGFNPSEPAPLTASKARAIEACISDIERALIELRDGTDAKVMTSSQISEYMQDCGLRVPAGRAISAAYEAAGLVPCDRLVTIGGKRHRVVALRDGDRFKGADSTTLANLLGQWE